MRRALLVSILLAFSTPGGAAANPNGLREPASAVEPTRIEEAAHADHEDPSDAEVDDYSRFSDGPRRVPVPRGASRARAVRLGLGDREASRRLTRGAPPSDWLGAAAWRGQPVERLLWPVEGGRYGRGFGYVRHTRTDLRHDGLDIMAPPGTPIRAAADGIVAYSDNGIRGYGNCVILIHPNGWVSLYAHNERTTVQPGWRVQRGERIALLGNTGISRGPHLHFELHHEGRPIDPIALFDGGPEIVARAAARAHRAGEVPAPREVAPSDHPEEAPIAGAPAGGAGDRSDELGGLAIGSEALYRRLMRFAPSAYMAERVGGRTFRDLLWPMRGGEVASATARALRARSTEPTPVRAPADALVVYAELDARRGGTLLLLHRSGWVTRLSGLDVLSVRAGERVERGAWIGEARELELQVRVEGRRVDPTSLLVRVPASS